MLKPSSAGTDYDQVVELYTELFADELTTDPPDAKLLDEFVRLVVPIHGPVVDLGCGPGHVTAHLAAGGLQAIGFDLSHGMVATAAQREPQLAFCQSDLRAVPAGSGTVVGVAARYSFIHLSADEQPRAFAECARLLAPGGHLFVSFFAASVPERHGEAFDHKASRAYFLHPRTMAELADHHGLELVRSDVRPQQEGERSDQAALLMIRR